jgi:NAD(P)-dependent dehydrogenase (short-subunit alcohol dehydrogenase family)
MGREPKSLHGKVVAITGGARGIGRATATQLVRAGARVAIGDLDIELARATADELGDSVSAYELDVTSRESVARFLDAVEADVGPLDVMINNAGIMPLGAFLDESDSSAERQLDINVHGVIFGMKEALPRMLARGHGHVVNLASVAGKGGFPHAATYCATKHAVIGLSEAVRQELRDTEIELTCVLPALVNTELGSGVEAGRAVKKLEPEEVAAAILDALRVPKVEVFVPASTGTISKVMALLPRRGREAIAHWLKADQILVQRDSGQRAAYEERAARSEPNQTDESESELVA